jgi:hypothetical protein
MASFFAMATVVVFFEMLFRMSFFQVDSSFPLHVVGASAILINMYTRRWRKITVDVDMHPRWGRRPGWQENGRG